ncbi:MULTISPECIES: molybdate ABC transporter substrate-binding protein [Thiomicrorhabdus]|uniref:Molybdate ABC transporter substrate-binding protein n=1 Tax=Thiomicrorhabdus heinhorstiae TaxID=2748010 RepID=A0ABS0BUT8_9GAMM|nr:MULTISPECIES: molybdate ABC transporter substrate-binding protein [Thiomicrorhabdus]MBF6057592.1 molybdate ABC transporter substrate-binding protein [Thiomicrorhabdus heinhorstiae]
MKGLMRVTAWMLALSGGMMVSSVAIADTAKIAVAANFTKTIEKIGEAFSQKTGHELKFSFGPTGKLYAQIKNGAPYDAFFGADERRPLKTIDDGTGLKESYFVYAQGQIALYSDKYPVKESPLQVLKEAKFNHLAIANPKTAPYGERAEAFMKSQGVYDAVKAKIVNGESIAHAFQYVATGNAEIGFVALSQLVDPQSPVYEKGQYWIVPQQDYAPIKQGALILKRGANNAAVKAFMEFIKTPAALEIIHSYGYSTP